ncbi:MAG: hypothetical protein CMO01_06985 [Thalassobius sp.]|nr:hypothetical protein [Thalassovita sp.]
MVVGLLLLVVSCSPKEENYQTANPLENAKWISQDAKLPDSDSLFYQNHPAPIFRKSFDVSTEVASATLFITAAGYYKVSIDGKAIEDNVLDPAWTDFSERIYYAEYDVTDKVAQGKNSVEIILGNGFYNPLPMKMWGNLNLRNALPTGIPAVIAKLVLKDTNGEIKEIVTDETWKYTSGPILKNSVYIGEVYDANLEVNGWQNPDFDDANWKNSVVVAGPGGELQKSIMPPVKVTDKFTSTQISSPEKDVYLVDMGTNFTGTYIIKLNGYKGDTVNFRFGERTYEDGNLNPMTTVAGQIKKKGRGGSGAPDVAWQTDSYIFSEDGEVEYSPIFTFHTYRYMEISGLSYEPKIQDIQGLAFNTDVQNENHFASSSDLLNSIQKATVRTFVSNLVTVQSDCPAREKFGYGGDLNATNESFMYNFDMHAFYKKTIYDWVDAINLQDSGFVDTAPFVGLGYCGISWESAFLVTQYYLYLYYGDTDLVKELYALDKQWMQKVARIYPDGVVREGLSDHESLKPVPVELTGTAHYLQCAKIMKTFAQLMNETALENEYGQLAEVLKDSLKTRFWDQPIKEDINRQTLFSTLIYHDVIPEESMSAAKDSLMSALQNGPSGHLYTGIFGTKYMLETLSKTGFIEDAFKMVNSTQYPGWGFMIDRGATTIWETWKESDNTYSNCHPMFGTVTEWFYRWLGGIQPIDGLPGFKKFTLSPYVPENLDWVKCNYHTPYGEIVSNWKKEGDKTLIFETNIPTASSAIFHLPEDNIEQVEIIKKNDGSKYLLEADAIQTGKTELKSGEYVITVILE